MMPLLKKQPRAILNEKETCHVTNNKLFVRGQSCQACGKWETNNQFVVALPIPLPHALRQCNCVNAISRHACAFCAKMRKTSCIYAHEFAQYFVMEL